MKEIIILFLIFSLISVIISLGIYIYRKGELFNPWIVFSSLSIIDVYIPAIFRVLFEEVNVYPIWMTSLDCTDLAIGVLLYYIGWLFFTVGYFTISRKEIVKNKKYIFHKKRGFIFLLSAILFYVFYFSLIFTVYGGFSNYLQISLSERFMNSFELPSYFFYLENVRIIALMLIFVTSSNLFYSDYIKDKFPRIRYIFIVIAIFFALTTLFRGTLLSYFIGFGALSYFYLKESGKRTRFIISRASRLIIIIAILFIVVGGGRTLYISTEVYSEDKKFSFFEEVNRNLTGSSLIGISSIVKYYGNNTDKYFLGKTIKDMILMPVPRAIYSSKPEWYGIDDITRQMGWPVSTQSATSPQGELFANFGYIGMTLMFFLGNFYGWMSKWSRNNAINMSVYSFVVMPSVLTTFWMSTTGLINSLKFIILIYFLVHFLFKRVSK